MVDLLDVGAHYAISSLFDGFHEQTSIYCYSVDLLDSHLQESGRARLAIGRARIASQITRQQMPVGFGVLHFGDHNLSAGVRRFRSEEQYVTLAADAGRAFGRADLPETLRFLDRHFAGTAYSLKSLFRDEQRRIISLILDSLLGEAEASYSQLYEHHSPLLRFFSELHVPLPKVLRLTAEFVLNSELRHALEAPALDLERIRALLHSAAGEQVILDAAGLEYSLRRRLNQMVDELAADPGNLALMAGFDAAIALVRSLPFEVDLWKVQNVYYHLLQTVFPERQHAADGWLQYFVSLGERLGMHVPIPASEQPTAA